MTADNDFAVDIEEIEAQRRERTWRLAAVELPFVRLVGTILLILGVYLNNRLLVEAPEGAWLTVAAVLLSYSAVTWLATLWFLRRDPPIDLTVVVLTGDLLAWTYAIYQTGAEQSWLFFVLLLRVADQVQTTFRRAVTFAFAATACYAAMLAWVVAVDGRDLVRTAALAKLVFILFAGIYISLAARTGDWRRKRLANAVRMSRDLIKRLEEAQKRAEVASAAKSEFVANMSHEMRTPLQGVIGMLRLAIEDEPSETTLRRLETARRSAETLLSMIDDILDFSRIEARKLELEPVYFSLRQLIGETMKSVGVLAASKGLTISYFVHPDCPETVWGDPLRVRQILVNLVGNSIKFTPHGEVSVRVSREEGGLCLEVRDTGVGISPAARATIFEPFTQGDSSLSRRHGGAGLGLAIVARLLEAMGGSVKVSSNHHAGSVFSVLLPLPADAIGSDTKRPPWERGLRGRSVLVLEPGPMSRATIVEILRTRGMLAFAAASAVEIPEGGRFDCAVTADPDVPVRPRIVLTTPLQHSDEPLQIARPMSERELLDNIGHALQLSGDVPLTLEPEVEPQRGRSVLLVDDNDVNREVVAEMLRRLRHEVTLAVNGEEALEILARERFDVVFMDVQLPGIDGLEVTQRFRAGGNQTPVIAVTAHSSREDRDRCLASGMNAVLTKPVSAAQLAVAIDQSGLDQDLAQIAGSNPALMSKVRKAFEQQTPQLLGAIRQAIERGDAHAVASHAHKLKGSLSYFEGRGTSLARDLESAAKEGELSVALAILPDLEQEIAAVSQRLAE